MLEQILSAAALGVIGLTIQQLLPQLAQRRFLLPLLLVLLAPLVSRWLAHGHVAAAVPVAAMDHSQHAQHAMEGHHDHHAMAMQQGEVAKKPPADPHAAHEMGVDCDYCLIAARLITSPSSTWAR